MDQRPYKAYLGPKGQGKDTEKEQERGEEKLLENLEEFRQQVKGDRIAGTRLHRPAHEVVDCIESDLYGLVTHI